jgi:hypothetical protein
MHVRDIIDGLRLDVSYAWRMVRRSPGFTFFATLTIALGLGANAAIFSLVDGVLLKSMSYPEPERIVQLWESRRAACATALRRRISPTGRSRASPSTRWPRRPARR